MCATMQKLRMCLGSKAGADLPPARRGGDPTRRPNRAGPPRRLADAREAAPAPAPGDSDARDEAGPGCGTADGGVARCGAWRRPPGRRRGRGVSRDPEIPAWAPETARAPQAARAATGTPRAPA